MIAWKQTNDRCQLRHRFFIRIYTFGFENDKDPFLGKTNFVVVRWSAATSQKQQGDFELVVFVFIIYKSTNSAEREAASYAADMLSSESTAGCTYERTTGRNDGPLSARYPCLVSE